MGFMHAGQMAEALARGFIDKGVVKAKDVHCTDPVQARREVFQSFGAQSQNSNVDVGSAISISRHPHQALALCSSCLCLKLLQCNRLDDRIFQPFENVVMKLSCAVQLQVVQFTSSHSSLHQFQVSCYFSWHMSDILADLPGDLQVAKNSEVIFLAVKPQYVSTVLKEIKQHLTDQHIVVSIAAGIPLAIMKVRCRFRSMHSNTKFYSAHLEMLGGA